MSKRIQLPGLIGCAGIIYLPKIGLFNSDGTNGVIWNLNATRFPKVSSLTTEYSSPDLMLTGVLPILIVFPTKSPTGKFHLFLGTTHKILKPRMKLRQNGTVS
jgi:hypothetical protein